MSQPNNLKVVEGQRDALVDEARNALLEMVISPNPEDSAAARERLIEIDRRLARTATLRLVHESP